ncbi:head GIN domain-containing protein [Pedobacter sp. ASV28]|uniref:head GIN domain-containing protein n=1 Tax=Pedobacter sp. ASV28 TaxID=2795123 RepID=UPI0018ED9B62|nr:head GIN domain-containing protein [Pedobacter sp. ASV28]
MIRNFDFFKTTFLVCILACGLSLATWAQSSRSVNASNFNSLTVSNGIDLFLSQGSSESIIIKGREEVIKNVVVEQNAGNLVIKYKDGVNWSRLFKNTDIKVYITYKKLNAITASGGSDVNTENILNTDKITLTTSGGSDLELNIVCKDITITTSGGSDLDLKGSAENMVLVASGGSDVDAYGFKVNYAKVNTSGGSDIKLYVEKALDVNASGGSDIHYKGNAALRKMSNSKSADITHIK